MSLSVDGRECSSFHFVGILGAGMSAIAQYLRWCGCSVSGSDRSLDSPDTAAVRDPLAALGCTLWPQDGSGVALGADTLVVSSAVENDNPDIAAAAARQIPVAHRSDVLAALVATHRTVAVAGTSGKSTVTGLVFDCLEGCGKSPSVISGAALSSVAARGAYGNAWHGTSDLLVVEADESDGTVVKYHPYLSLLLNISRDHKDESETEGMLRRLASQSQRVVVNADDPRCAAVPHHAAFGLTHGQWRPDRVVQTTPSVSFVRNGITYACRLPGDHNLSNALAACTVCEELGCAPEHVARALASSGSIARRFEMRLSARGVRVVDDYAHNPAKIEAALRTAQCMAPRVFALFQPHGFGPTRFVRRELAEVFSRVPRSTDHVLVLPIYYAGGTVQRDISSADVTADVTGHGQTVLAPATREESIGYLAEHAREGDLILVMGARDPSLPGFVDRIAAVL